MKRTSSSTTESGDFGGKRILFDATNSMSTTLNTGIQRVVRSVIREASKLNAIAECVPVVFKNGDFYDARPRQSQFQKRLKRSEATKSFCRSAGSLCSRVHPSFDSIPTRGLERLRKMFYPATLGRSANTLYWKTVGEKIQFSERDILITLDASWMYPIWPALVEAQRKGCKIGSMIHDLIPIRYPQFVGQAHLSTFQNWMDQAVEHADFFLANSQTTRADVQDYVRETGRRSVDDRLFGSFRLGADFSKAKATSRCRRELFDALHGEQGCCPYLIVGTVEPRKNHDYLLDAFEMVWRKNPGVRLCIAGAIGWKCDAMVDRIRCHPRFGKSLFMFNDLSDAELRYCYRHTKALVFPSIVEGFGLPIVEALHFGLRVLASNTPIHREVGGEFCRYFDLSNAASLAAMIDTAESQGIPPVRNVAEFKTVTWSESCRELIERIMELACAAENVVSGANSKRQRSVAA